ncbi:MAG: VanZ family protein [Caulobacter sp.]|nr:VanZ family protein [Caulobacter sp.]
MAILWLSLAPAEDLPQVTLWDKLEHAAAYLGLAVLGGLAFPNHLWRMAGSLFTFGVGVEVFQALMAVGRQGDPADALANTVGIATGLLLTLAVRELVKVKSPAGGE